MLQELKFQDELAHYESLVLNRGKGRLLEVIRELERIAARRHRPIVGYSCVSLRIFLSMAEYAQDALIKQAADYVEITSAVSEQYQFDPEVSLNEELDYLDRAFWKYGLKSKHDVSSILTKGDVIEIYNGDSLQIYRNFEFFRHCSYSFLDLMTQEWFVLYERPQYVVEAMHDMASVAMSDDLGFRPFSRGSEHILRERYLDNKKAFFIRMKFAGPLQDLAGQPAALLTTLSAELLCEGDEAAKIRMI